MPLTEIFSISITTKSATLAFLRSSTGHASDPRRKLREHTLRSLYSWQNLERSMNQSHNLRTVIEIKLLKETSASPWHVTVTRWIKLPTRGNQQNRYNSRAGRCLWIQSWTESIVSMATDHINVGKVTKCCVCCNLSGNSNFTRSFRLNGTTILFPFWMECWKLQQIVLLVR